MAQEITDLASLIHDARAQKKGNREFALFSNNDGSWTAQIGNLDAPSVRLGEGRPEIEEEGASPEEAVGHLIKTMQIGPRHDYLIGQND
ncbi:MAG: hypothetical protein MUE52_04530 [Tabrizicola sp.]|jgi:hypothetical protein|nr:hypothetical protein [Tabrizicola sp.]